MSARSIGHVAICPVMRVFIVHAHPEPKSFNGAMTRAASEALREAGHEIEVSDLYAMGFNPVSGRGNRRPESSRNVEAS